MLSEVLNKITKDPQIIERWKSIVAKDLKTFAKRTNPYKKLKFGNFFFYVDTKSLSYAVIIRGCKPNAGFEKAFNAPVSQREPAIPPRHVHLERGWRTIDTKRKTSSQLGFGIKPLATQYFGVSRVTKNYFGLNRKNKRVAYGLSPEGVAVPIYSDTGLVEWVVDKNADELSRILEEAGFQALNGGIK